MTADLRAYRALALLVRRGAGVPDATADAATARHAAAVLRGVR